MQNSRVRKKRQQVIPTKDHVCQKNVLVGMLLLKLKYKDIQSSDILSNFSELFEYRLTMGILVANRNLILSFD